MIFLSDFTNPVTGGQSKNNLWIIRNLMKIGIFKYNKNIDFLVILPYYVEGKREK